MKKVIYLICGLIFAAGCIDLGDLFSGILMEASNSVSVSPKGDVAFHMDNDIYISDLKGSRFIKVTEDGAGFYPLAWSKDGLLYAKEAGDRWILNLYIEREGAQEILQEMDAIVSVISGSELSYIVLTKDGSPFGNLNIYERATSRIYTLLTDVYYDYEWLPGKRKIAAITSEGILLIKDIDTLEEEVVFKGAFKENQDYMDIRTDNKIIFSREGEIYIYDIGTKELSKWLGPDGYDFRMPPSVNSGLKGYVLAKVKSVEGEWKGQLYLVKPDGGLIPMPSWPFWIDEPMVVCVDPASGDVLITNLDTNETINLNESQKNRTGS